MDCVFKVPTKFACSSSTGFPDSQDFRIIDYAPSLFIPIIAPFEVTLYPKVLSSGKSRGSSLGDNKACPRAIFKALRKARGNALRTA